MKHIHTLLMTALLSTSALAEDTVEPGTPAPEAQRTILGLSIMPLFGDRVLEVEGERVVGPRLSVGLGLRTGLSHAETRLALPDGSGFGPKSGQTGFLLGVEPRVRVFLTGTAPEGLWVSPRLGLSHFQSKSETDVVPVGNTFDRRSWTVSGAALLGYSAIVGRGLAVQFGAGLEARSARSVTKSRMLELGSDGGIIESESRDRSWSMSERLDLSVGWAF
ncbi:hypothetical protein [Pyxidicoccus trucidator]|uniref:hypothetical protein n=1 Tax=Pyxidicoccus trucidator TaxID=2709662 RepID=UPI0013DC8279|nr:hypothetical protein [Pyxidicoccus trucidator]